MKAGVVVLLVLVSLAQPALAADTVTLTVSVVDDSGSPVSDATLTANWDGDSTTRTTASNGKAFVDVPEGENVTISVEHESYVRNNPLRIVDAEESDVELTVYPKAEATVAVVDGAGAVEDAQIRFVKRGHVVARGETDESGEFSTGVIESGDYDVRVKKPGYYVHTTELSVDNETNADITIERGSVTVDFNVTDDHFEPVRAITGATVSVDGFGSVNTLDDGENAMRLPVNTEYSVTVGKSGYQNASGSITIGEKAYRTNFTMQRAPTLTAETVSERVVAGEKLRVDVTDEYGAPVAGATVLVDGESVGTTDGEGVLVPVIESGGEHEIEATKGSLESEPVVVQAIGDTETESEQTPTAATSTTSRDDSTGVGLPGFEFGAALIAIALAAALAVGRMR